MGELEKHAGAFDKYYGMGSDRSLSKLREQMSPNGSQNVPSLKTLKRWSKQFDWQQRVEQRDIEIAKRLERKTNTTIVNTKAKYRRQIIERRDDIRLRKQYLTKAFATAKEKLEKGEIKAASIKDITELAKAMDATDKEDREWLKVDLLLMGEATEKQEQDVSVKLDVMSDGSRTEHLELLNRFAAVCNGGKESVAEPAPEPE